MNHLLDCITDVDLTSTFVRKNQHSGRLYLHFCTFSTTPHTQMPIVTTTLYFWTISPPSLSNLQLLTSPTDITSACWNLQSSSQDGEHNTTAAGRKSHHYVATPSHTDGGRGRHQSFTNSFKCERVLVVSAKGGRWSGPEALSEGRARRRMGGKGLPTTEILPSGSPTSTLRPTPPDSRPDGSSFSPTKTI